MRHAPETNDQVSADRLLLRSWPTGSSEMGYWHWGGIRRGERIPCPSAEGRRRCQYVCRAPGRGMFHRAASADASGRNSEAGHGLAKALTLQRWRTVLQVEALGQPVQEPSLIP